MFQMFGAAALVCATLLSTPPREGAWRLECPAVGRACEVSRLELSHRQRRTMWARIQFRYEDQGLVMRIKTPPLFVPWIELNLSARGEKVPIRAHRCSDTECDFISSASRQTLERMFASEALTLTTRNTWGGGESLRVDLADLKTLLAKLPRDL